MAPRQRSVTVQRPSHDNVSTSTRKDDFGGSFVLLNGEPVEPWIWAFPHPGLSYIVFPPPPEPDRARAYGDLNWADDYLEAAKAALRDGDDLSARMALHTLAGLVKVVTGQLGGTSSQYLCNTETLQ
jgi:hypothetical protein